VYNTQRPHQALDLATPAARYRPSGRGYPEKIEPFDYGPEATNVTWFLTAGSSKILVQDFVAVNGYNPAFLGWGSEDSEFGLRLQSFGCPVVEWKRRPECAEALILTLEHSAMSRSDAVLLSRQYWGGPPTPGFVTRNDPEFGVHLERQYDKRCGFYDEDQRIRNLGLYQAAWRLPDESRRRYFASAGVNLLNPDALLRVDEDGRTSHLVYDTRSVMTREPPPIAEFNSERAHRTRACATHVLSSCSSFRYVVVCNVVHAAGVATSRHPFVESALEALLPPPGSGSESQLHRR
jgi:hypothetical protein